MKIRVTSKVNLNEDEIANKVAENLRELVFSVEADAKRFAPVNTGRLRNGIFVRENSRFNYDIVSPVEYSAHVRFGS